MSVLLVLLSPSLEGYQAAAQVIKARAPGSAGPSNVPHLSLGVGKSAAPTTSRVTTLGLSSLLPSVQSPQVTASITGFAAHSRALPLLSPEIVSVAPNTSIVTPLTQARPKTNPAPSFTGREMNRVRQTVDQMHSGKIAPSLALESIFEGSGRSKSSTFEPPAIKTHSPGSERSGLKPSNRGEKLKGVPQGVRSGAGLPLLTVTPEDGEKTDANDPEAEVTRGKRITSLLVTQALTILNDSALKTLFAVWVTATMPLAQAALFISLGTGLYVIPFMLFSVFAGKLADRTSKTGLIRWLKIAEVGIVALAGVALYFGSLPALFGIMFLMGTQSSLMTPAKYSLLAERAAGKGLAKANGLLEMSASFAMMAGTAAGGLLFSIFSGALPMAALPILAIAVLGVISSFFIKKDVKTKTRPPSEENKPPRKDYKMPRALFGTALALAIFWFVASMIQMNIFIFGEHALHVGEGMITGLLTVMGISMGLGSYLAGLFSKSRAERGFVPLAAIGVIIPLIYLGLLGGTSLIGAFVALAALGLSAGFYFVPLNTYLQRQSPDDVRGRNLGVTSFIGYSSILLSAAGFYALNNWMLASPQTIFLVTAGLTGLAMIPVIWKLWTYTMAFLRRIFGLGGGKE